MNVAFNASILCQPRTGIGEYALQLGHALQAEQGITLNVFDGWRWRQDFPQPVQNAKQSIVPILRKHLPGAYAMRRFLLQQRFRSGVKKLKSTVYHEPSLWPLDFDGATLMTLHDLTHVHYPQTQPRERLREIERRLPKALAQSSLIFTDSAFIAQEACQHYAISANKIRVAPLGCSARFHPRSAAVLRPQLQRLQLHMRRYFLCLGTLEPRKNTLLALSAYLRLPPAMRQAYPLLLVGLRGWGQAEWSRPLEQAIASGQVRALGYQDDDTVAALLAGACALLFPSRYEGFGLPVLEAMASATPVITCRRGAIPEVAAEAALYVEPDDVDACSHALATIAEDTPLQHRLATMGLERARHFSWARCAQITAAGYRQAGSM